MLSVNPDDPGREAEESAGPVSGSLPMRDVVPELERPAEPTLEIGVERVDSFVAEDRLLTDVGGTIGSRVLSTPGMIAVMERTSAVLAYQHLPEGQATVGFEVCVKHVAAALEGTDLTVRSSLREVVDGRKLRFEVEVLDGDRTIGIGTHERRVIQVGQLG